MSFNFDPDLNPYADDLLRLNAAPRSRYSNSERLSLAKFLVAKLYLVTHDDIGDGLFGWSHWEHGGTGVDLHVLFEAEGKNAGGDRGRIRFRRQIPLIAVSVGPHGVIELFNGLPDESTQEKIDRSVQQIERGEPLRGADAQGAIPRRDTAEAANAYSGRNDAEIGSGAHDPVGAGDGRGADSGRGGGGRGGGDGNAGGGNAPGRGGVGELINHPVLFSVDPAMFDALLDEI